MKSQFNWNRPLYLIYYDIYNIAFQDDISNEDYNIIKTFITLYYEDLMATYDKVYCRLDNYVENGEGIYPKVEEYPGVEEPFNLTDHLQDISKDDLILMFKGYADMYEIVFGRPGDDQDYVEDVGHKIPSKIDVLDPFDYI